MVPLIGLATTYFAANTLLTAVAIWLESGLHPWTFLQGNRSHLGVNYVVSLFLLLLIVENAQSVSFATLGVIIPLLIMSYFSSRTSIQLVESANQHVAEVNQLYLSTVESLATAIDAKDHVTHGHIRRVQQGTVRLAERLGVTSQIFHVLGP